jgi:DNA-binding NtrC family response regulator
LAFVVVIEDDGLTRELVEMVLGDAGHQARLAVNASQALQLLGGDEPVDVLFTDINLEADGPSGFELARKALQIRAGLRVIYTTGSMLTDDMRRQFVDGALFLQKPYSIDAFLTTLRTSLARAPSS